MTAPRAAVEVVDVRVAFGGVTALAGMSVRVAEGEVVAVLGPNGSGKTTLLNAITGFVTVDEGAVRLFGRDVTKLPTHKRVKLDLGRSFQNLRVVPRSTVSELLQFGWNQRDPRTFGLSIVRPFWLHSSGQTARGDAGRALERVGLPGQLLDARAASLSQGQLKLVDIVRALMAQPRVLLLDEPTSGLSHEEVAQMSELISTLRGEGITMMVVEHDVRFVLSFADRVVVMESGRLLAEGDPHETMALPRVVDAYLGQRRRADQSSGDVPSSESRT